VQKCPWIHNIIPVRTAKIYQIRHLFYGFALPLLAVLRGKRLWIGVRFGHTIYGSNLTECGSDIWSIMCAYDYWWAFSIKMHAFYSRSSRSGEEVSSLSFEVWICCKGQSHSMMSPLFWSFFQFSKFSPWSFFFFLFDYNIDSRVNCVCCKYWMKF
jgi:hypothetical protein